MPKKYAANKINCIKPSINLRQFQISFCSNVPALARESRVPVLELTRQRIRLQRAEPSLPLAAKEVIRINSRLARATSKDVFRAREIIKGCQLCDLGCWWMGGRFKNRDVKSETWGSKMISERVDRAVGGLDRLR